MAESETNRQIQTGRDGADQVRKQNRENTDAKTDLGRSGRTKLHKNRTPEEMTADNSLSAQRKLDDAQTKSDRFMMDAALAKERILMTNELSSHQATKAALTSRDEFLAIVSHDLRNPIGAILSYAELLLEESSRDDGEAKQWAEVIKRNAKTSLRLISDILDIERFATGKLQMNFASRDVEALVRETVESFSHRALEKNITLSAKYAQKNDLVFCDRDRIEQILANLLSNALKFTPAGGRVTVQVEQTDHDITLSITDTGAGIPEDQKKRIFDRYTQLGNLNREGLGLGLYISTMLVEAHRGKIQVLSEPGEGSTFSFKLPLKEG